MRRHVTYEELAVTIADIAAKLRFGIAAEEFERAFDDLGRALGFATQRPDRQYRAGPDNLWALGGQDYLLVEAKSEVAATRAEITKKESGQMNNACGWFREQYDGAAATRILVIPPRMLATGAVFGEDVRIMRAKHLNALAQNVRAFFAEFRAMALTDITEAQVQERLIAHKLTVKDLTASRYAEPPVSA